VRLISIAVSFALVVGTAAVLLAGEDKSKTKLADLAWLAGDWTSDDGDFDEHWLPPKGDAMYAVSRLVVDGGKTQFCELSLIEETGDGLWYRIRHFDRALKPWAMDKDGPMSMKLLSLEGKKVVFEDPAKDFPRRVVYERKGDRLTARLEGEKGGHPKIEEFSFKPSK
jgi:hypothetical protein